MQQAIETTPWYRQFWPWFIMALPATAVVAGITTVVIAVQNRDSLVVDDYYKEGLAINRSIDRDHMARQLGVNALVRFDAAQKQLTIQLAANDSHSLPAQLQLQLTHPTLNHLDRQLTLSRQGSDRYQATLDTLAPGRWYVMIEPDDSSWRLTGRMDLAHGGQTTLMPIN